MNKLVRGLLSTAVNVYIDGVSYKNQVLNGGTVGQDSSRGNPFPQNAVQEFRVRSPAKRSTVAAIRIFPATPRSTACTSRTIGT